MPRVVEFSGEVRLSQRRVGGDGDARRRIGTGVGSPAESAVAVSGLRQGDVDCDMLNSCLLDRCYDVRPRRVMPHHHGQVTLKDPANLRK